MSSSARIEGVEDAIRVLEEYPNKINSAVKRAMRNSIKPLLIEIKNSTHKRHRRLVKSKFLKAKEPTMMFGLFGEKALPNGRAIPDWFKAYWKNYGTLARRDSGHKFVFKRKNITEKWKGGIAPSRAFDKVIEGKESVIEARFVSEIIKEAEKLENGK